MSKRHHCFCGTTSIPLFLLILIVCQFVGCSKTIYSIGPFEGYWSGYLGFFVTSGQDGGIIQFEVDSDHSVAGYGELWYRRGSERSLMFTINITGHINPNSSLECAYKLNWVYPGSELRDWFPSKNGDSIKQGKISGFLNPALNYGEGFCLSSKEEIGYFYWIAYRQQQ